LALAPRADGTSVLGGEIDGPQRDALANAFHVALDCAERGEITIEAGDLDFIDAGGTAVLAAAAHARTVGVKVRVSDPSRILTVLGARSTSAASSSDPWDSLLARPLPLTEQATPKVTTYDHRRLAVAPYDRRDKGDAFGRESAGPAHGATTDPDVRGPGARRLFTRSSVIHLRCFDLVTQVVGDLGRAFQYQPQM